MINVFQPELGKEELAAIEKIFASNWVGKGKITDKFEERFAEHLNVSRTLVQSINSCTEGLFQSMKLLNMGMGDEIILPTISFVGAANAVVDSGAKPVFCDVDPRTLNPTAEMIKEKIGPKTKAIIVLHYGGVPCEMDEIIALCKEFDIAIIEDCACAVASTYKERPCGTLGDIGIWSFDSMKVLVTCDGGMVYCRHEDMVDRLSRQIYFGMTAQSGVTNTVDNKWWEFDVTCAGRRSVINDVTATIGLEQLKKLHDVVERRSIIHNTYNIELADVDVTLPPQIPEHSASTYYFYWIQHPKRDELARFLKERGIYTTFRYYPLHRVKFYEAYTELPNADLAAETTLCLPIHQALKSQEIESICNAIGEFLNG